MTELLVVLGTRPEIVKLAPVVAVCRERGLGVWVLSTGQHRELLGGALADVGLVVDEDLALMQPAQSLGRLAARILDHTDLVLARRRPAYVLVQGDTTTVAMAALAACYRRVPLGHVEAGLRSGNPDEPFPEEAHRRLATILARDHFAPTPGAVANLVAAGVPADRIHLVGNTGIDTLLTMRDTVATLPLGQLAPALAAVRTDRPLVLLTFHRRESFGAPLLAVAAAVGELARRFPDVAFVCPLHPNPEVQDPLRAALGEHPNLHLVAPLPYPAMVKLLSLATLTITDSGGVQEEAATLGCPALVTRRVTDRPESIAAGVARLVGTDTALLVAEGVRLLHDPAARAAMARPVDVYGDGRAARRIAAVLEQRLRHHEEPGR